MIANLVIYKSLKWTCFQKKYFVKYIYESWLIKLIGLRRLIEKKSIASKTFSKLGSNYANGDNFIKLDQLVHRSEEILLFSSYWPKIDCLSFAERSKLWFVSWGVNQIRFFHENFKICMLLIFCKNLEEKVQNP